MKRIPPAVGSYGEGCTDFLCGLNPKSAVKPPGTNQMGCFTIAVMSFSSESSFGLSKNRDTPPLPSNQRINELLFVGGHGLLSGSRRVVGYPSGQRGQTVNLLAYAFDGSNPSPTTMFFSTADIAVTF